MTTSTLYLRDEAMNWIIFSSIYKHSFFTLMCPLNTKKNNSICNFNF